MCTSPLYITNTDRRGKHRAYRCRCGRCVECKSQDRQEWAFRMLQEYKYRKCGVFVTLTYNNDNLPYNQIGIPQLRYRDVQLFLKRLRSELPPHISITYWSCGEYGKLNARPHYHLIIFGLPKMYYYLINKCWGKGFVYLGYKLTGKCINYVSKYVQKQGAIKFTSHLIGSDDWCAKNQVTPPFRHMSLGIGKSYLTDSSCKFHLGLSSCPTKYSLPVFINGKLVYSTPILTVAIFKNEHGDIIKYSMPRYYRRKIFHTNYHKFFDYATTTSNLYLDYFYKRTIDYYTQSNNNISDVDFWITKDQLFDSELAHKLQDISERKQPKIAADLVRTHLQPDDYADLTQDELIALSDPHKQKIYW